MKDTPDHIEQMYRDMQMKLSPAERLAVGCRMFEAARALALAGIQDREGPIDDPVVIRQKLFLHFYRNDFSPEETEKILESTAKAGK